MSQTRLQSFVETCISTAIGFALSFVLTATVMPAYGHQVVFADNLQITAIFTAASIARGWAVRRFFNHLHMRKSKCPSFTASP